MDFSLIPTEILDILKPRRSSYEFGTLCSCHILHHGNHRPLPRSVVRRLLVTINELTREMHRYDEVEMRASWYYGRLAMQLVLEGGLWHPRDCGLCYLSRFLTGWGVYPWLVGLKLLGQEGIYESCLRELEQRGLGRRMWIRWVERVVRRFTEMKSKEWKRGGDLSEAGKHESN